MRTSFVAFYEGRERMIKLYLAVADGRDEHTVGTALARYALCDAYGANAPLKKDARGKPYFEGVPIYVSISHSKGTCLAAISDGEIGADIELTGGEAEHLSRLARRYFTKAEAEYVCASPCDRFYEIWCAKESYMKYTGEGFARTMSSFSVLDSKMCFSRFEYGEYHVTVCSAEYADTPPTLISADKLF